jgi:hypothetical protein
MTLRLVVFGVGPVNTVFGFTMKPDVIEIVQRAWESSRLMLSMLMHGEQTPSRVTTMTCYWRMSSCLLNCWDSTLKRALNVQLQRIDLLEFS